MNVKIPAIPDKYWQDDAVPLIKKRITNVIEAKYGSIINNIANLTGLDKNIIKSFIFIESGGDNVTQGLYANGLMEVGLASASDTLAYEKSSGRMSDAEAVIVKKTLGSRWALLEKLKPNQRSTGTTYVTSQDLLNTEFNILVGSLLLKQMCDEFLRLDKVAVIYNSGRYSKAGKIAIAHTGTTQELIAKIPVGQANYIRKLIGVNSTLDLLV